MKLIGMRVRWPKRTGGTVEGEIVAVDCASGYWRLLIVTSCLRLVGRLAEDCEIVPVPEGHPYR